MKSILMKLMCIFCVMAMMTAISCPVFADGINNRIIGEQENGTQTVQSFLNRSGLQMVMDTGDGDRITLPTAGSYFSEAQVMYVDAPKKNSIYAYQLPKADKSKIMNYPYHGIKVLAIARQAEFTCIIYNDNNNNDHAAWVESQYLTYTFPGTEHTIGLPCVSYAYDIGDPAVSWSPDYFVGAGQRYTILKDKAHNCVQFTLDYQVIGRGEATYAEEIYGSRKVYVNDGSGWIMVGQFEYSDIDTAHVVINLPEPMDLAAVATVAVCDLPDAFIFRQGILDVMTQ